LTINEQSKSEPINIMIASATESKIWFSRRGSQKIFAFSKCDLTQLNKRDDYIGQMNYLRSIVLNNIAININYHYENDLSLTIGFLNWVQLIIKQWKLYYLALKID